MQRIISVSKKFILGFCRCGCGTEIVIRNKRKKLSKYVLGHQHLNENNPRWNGGRTIDSYGYINVRCRDHHFVNARGYVKEHRLVWEKHNKACLLPWADVHHINENRIDNRIENLEAMMHGKHMEYNYSNIHKINKLGQFTKIRH